MSRTNQILITVSLIIFSISPSFGDWKENANAIDISGGENHTLVLTKNKTTWACGPNGDPVYSTYYGVLGTGSTNASLIAKTLIRVLGGNMGTEYLQDINDVEARWKHSLALESYDPSDPNYNGYVWAWGWNGEGQLGDPEVGYATTPVQVLRGAQAPADTNTTTPF
jgi:alpha-tubulin suppressor-like RCC1 family protein